MISPVGLVPRVDMGDMARMRVKPAALLNVWIYFNLVANTILLPILVATFLFSKRVKRLPTLVNLCMTWIFSGIFSLLLFYAGQYKTPEPSNHSLCIAQTSLLYGITPMWSVAVFVMIFHMIAIIEGFEVGPLIMNLMLASPYIAQSAFSIATLIVSVQHPEDVTRQRRFLYCALNDSLLSNTMCVFTAVVCVGITILELRFAIILFRRWRGLRRVGQSAHLDAQLFLRVFVFGIYIFFGMIVNFIDMFDSHSLAPDMYAATIGTVLVLVFGTQQDVLQAWCCWRKGKPRQVVRVHLHVTVDDPESQDKINLLRSASPDTAFPDYFLPPPQAAKLNYHWHH